MKKIIFSILFFLNVMVVMGQSNAAITGKVVDSKTQQPMQSVIVSIQNTNLMQLTDLKGHFSFVKVGLGNQILSIRTNGYREQLIQVEIVEGQILDFGTITLEEDQTIEQQLSLITITESDLGDDNSGSESTAGLLQASRDVFQQAAAFNWGQARFRIRGLDNENATTMINGIIMNKIYDGRPQWNNWGGLNDATRNQEFTMGSAPSDYTFGGILGTQEINTRASIYRPGTRLSFSGTNTNYSWRSMVTHASGMNKNGWAYVLSASRRWATEGYFDGTDYAASSGFASIEKKINDHHSLNFTSFYAENTRGKSSPNSDEVVLLAGKKYNSYWGYQDGKKRNSRDKDVEEPIFMLNHFWKISDKTNLNSSVSYQFGKISNSRIDNQGADSPDPTYYRNLPSFYTSTYNRNDYTDFQGNSQANSANGLAAKNNFLNNRQIDWGFLYNTNKETSDGHSAYILYEDRTDDKVWAANTILNTQLADHIIMNSGATFRKLDSHNFAKVLDLLGGQYYKDYDNFQSGSAQEADLNSPGRQVVVGDTFAYSYNLTASTIDAFTQFKFIYKKIDFYLAQTFVRTQYQREGLYKNGLYPVNSFGKGAKYIFENFGFKGGLTYKISGKHYLNYNAAYLTKAPTLRNVFPNARLNNNAIDGILGENIASMDASYIIRTPKLKSRITAFYSTIKNATETSFFFGEGIFDDNDGDGGDAFVAETVTDIEKLNIGVELGIEYQITSTIKLTANAGYGEYTFNNNPRVSLNNDNLASPTNTNPTIDFGTAKLKGYRLAAGPQTATSVGIEYRDPNYWWIGANANFLANNYLDVSSLLRTNNFFKNPQDPYGLDLPFPEATDERAAELLKQKRFDDFTLVNLVGGKSWKFNNTMVGFFASINNVFNVVYKTGGFEQARNANFREVNQDVSSGTPAFAPRYFYGYGTTYFVNFYVNF